MARHLSEGRLAARLKAAKQEAAQPQAAQREASPLARIPKLPENLGETKNLEEPKTPKLPENLGVLKIPKLPANPAVPQNPAVPKNPAAEQVPPDQAKHLTERNGKPATSAATKWKAAKLSASFCWLASEMCVRYFSWQGKTQRQFSTTSSI